MTDDKKRSDRLNPVDEFLQYQYKEIKDLCSQLSLCSAAYAILCELL